LRKKRKKKRTIKTLLFLLIIFIIILITYKTINKEHTKNKEKKVETKEVVKMQDAPITSEEFDKLEDGDYITKKGYTLSIIDNIAYIDGLMIANKTFSLPNDYIPKNPYSGLVDKMSCTNCIDKTVMESFKEMQADASSLGLNIYIQSGYRSYERQEILFNNYKERDGEEAADTYSSRPGHSEHQTGFCFDLNSIDDTFTNTNEGKWVNENAYLYGFVIRFPKGKEEYTGYIYESWHLRYVGKEIAKKLYNNGDWLSIEEYYGITSRYK